MEEKKKTPTKKAATKKTASKKTTKKPAAKKATVKKEVVKKPKKIEEISNEVVDIEDNEPIGPQPTVPSIKVDDANTEIQSFEMPKIQEESDTYKASRIEPQEEVPTFEQEQPNVSDAYAATTANTVYDYNPKPEVETYKAARIEPQEEVPTFEPTTNFEENSSTVEINEPIIEDTPVVEDVPVYEEPTIETEQTVAEPVVENVPIYEEQPQIEETTNTEVVESQVEMQPVTYAEPIAEIPNVSIEDQTLPSMDSQIITDRKDVKVRKKKAKDVRTILLVILLLGLFGFVMFMPNIQDLINKFKKDVGLSEIEKQAKQIEERQNQDSTKKTQTEDGTIVSEKLSKLTCTTNIMALDSYDKIVEEVFEYNSKNEVINSKYTTTYRFNTQNDKYESLKTECNENSLKYVDKAGYEVACSYNDTEVVISDVFELKTYKTIQEGSKIIEANARYKENINSIKTRLESIGYACR